MSLSVSSVAGAIVNPISPSIGNEMIWGKWFSGTDNLFCLFKAAMVGAELHQKSHIFHSLPHQNLSIPLMLGVITCKIPQVEETRLGKYISRNLDNILQAAHVGLIYGDYAAGKKLTASVRLITWAYYHAPKEDIPKTAQKVMENAILIAVWINVGVYFYRRPVLTAVVATTVTALSILTFAFLKQEQIRIERERLAREANSFWNSPVVAVKRWFSQSFN